MSKKIFREITALLLSLILALTAALGFSSAPAMAATSITYTVESVGFTDGYDLYYNAAARNVPFYEIVTPTVVNQYAYPYYKYKVPLQLTIRNPGSIGYTTGILAYNVSYNFDKNQVYSGGEYMEFAEFPVSQGEGYSWSFRPHGAKSGTVVVILDNYDMSTYGVPGPDWWIHLQAEMPGDILLGSTYDAYDFTASAMLNTLQVSSSPGGSLADNISAAINSSSSIQNIITLLDAISGDTALLQDVVNNLDNISGVLANVYSQLQQGNTYLNGLGWALAGIDIQAADGNTISQAVYDRWVSIIKKAMDDSAPDMEQQESQLEDANQQLSDQESLEDDVYQFSGDNISSINWNLEVPDQIAGAALIIMAMVEKIWAQLGILQFAVTAACTVGLVTIVLGVVNRFSSIKARESRRSAAKGNKSPGNENKTN